MNERKLTKAELETREKVIKDLKKNKSSLVKRYGKDAEAVMYGRATNIAKKAMKEENKNKIREMIRKTLVKEQDIEVGADRFEDEQNLNKATNLLDDLEQKLKTHDWFFMMSDDPRMFNKGGEEQTVIRGIMDELKSIGYFEDAKALYNQYAPSMGGIDLKMKESKKSFPDLTGDGKVTRADVLKGRGVELDEETRSVGPMIKSNEFKVGDKVKYKGMNHEITRIIDDRIYIKNLKYGGRPDTWVKAIDLKNTIKEYTEEVDTLALTFKDPNEFERAKEHFESTSDFYPYEINDEFRTFHFEVQDQADADSTEYYLTQELEGETDLQGYYFSIETSPLNLDEDLDLGHTDNEPHMLKEGDKKILNVDFGEAYFSEDMARKIAMGLKEMGLMNEKVRQIGKAIMTLPSIQENIYEDLDLGHEDNEPHMLKADLYKIGKYAMELYQMVDKFEGQGEVDFPHWWQAKIIKAASMISSAKHYLEFELKEPQVDAMVDVIDQSGALDNVGLEEDKPVANPNKHIKGIQIQLDQLGVKYEMDPKNKVQPFKVIYKPVNKDDEWYDNFEDIVFRYNLKGVVKTSMNEVSKESVNEQADHVSPMVVKAYKEYLQAKKDGDGEKAYRYYSKKLNNTYSTRADRDAIETILKKKYGSVLNKVNESFSNYSNNELLAYIKELSKQRASAASKRQDTLVDGLNKDIKKATLELKKRTQKLKDLSRTDIDENIEEDLYEGIEFNTSKYKGVHGKEPKGTGVWAFKVGDEEFMTKSMSYADAKKEAAKKAKEKGARSVTVLSELTDYMKRRKAQDDYAVSKKDKPAKPYNPNPSGKTDYMKRREKELTEKIMNKLKEDVVKGSNVKKVGDDYRVLSGKTGKMWPQKYKTKKDAENAIQAYHANKAK